MKCFKVASNEVENSVIIDGVVFLPQQCTAEEEAIVIAEMENEWYIHSDYKTTTEYCELYSSSSGSVMVYNIKTQDAVLHNDQVIGFIISGYNYDSKINGKYFPIQDHENFNYKFESHSSYDHGDGDVDTISYCSLRKKDPRKIALMNDYCIRYEENEKVYYKRITNDILRENETGVSVKVDIETWINFNDVGKKIKTDGFLCETSRFATLVKQSDLTEVNELIDKYCIRWETDNNEIKYKEISYDSIRIMATVVEIDLGSYARGRLRLNEIGNKVGVCRDYATLVKKSELTEFNILMDEYCIRWEKGDIIEYEEVSYEGLIKTKKSIGIKKDSWLFRGLLLCEAGKNVYIDSENATATLVKKSDLLELNKLINEHCICWEEDGEVEHEDISYSHFIEDDAGLKVKIGKWKRLRFDDLDNKILVTTNKYASLVRKQK